ILSGFIFCLKKLTVSFGRADSLRRARDACDSSCSSEAHQASSCFSSGATPSLSGGYAAAIDVVTNATTLSKRTVRFFGDNMTRTSILVLLFRGWVPVKYLL